MNHEDLKDLEDHFFAVFVVSVDPLFSAVLQRLEQPKLGKVFKITVVEGPKTGIPADCNGGNRYVYLTATRPTKASIKPGCRHCLCGPEWNS